MAHDIHALLGSLGVDKATIVGHDIGLMVAYAYAAQYPAQTERVVLMDAFLPGIGNWKDMWLLRDLWHFHFYGEVPLALVAGRERIYLEHFWNDFAADPHHSVPEAERVRYATAYAQPGAMRAGFEWFRNFERDAADFARMAQHRWRMPVRVIAGEKSGGSFLIEQVRLVADDVDGTVIPGTGHWLLEEAPDLVVPILLQYVH
jgi:pimeloyl-ACP methyl ester carboxylesterase